MNKRVEKLEIISNERLNKDNNLIILKSETVLEDIKPGQFVNMLAETSPTTFLRRPFSINFVDYEANTLHILIKRVGDGSIALTDQPVGSYIDTIFPVGNSFTMVESNEAVLLVGGGVGVAPMLYLAEKLKAITPNINILLGSRTGEDQILLDRFKEYGDLLITTEDGSMGERGFVTNHPIFVDGLKGISRVYTCGPDPMMQAVAKSAKACGVDCEVSLENMMACGFGVCLCCVTETTEGNKCVCSEGPVFNTKKLAWQI